MEITRKPFQGVLNIIRFNWHFYILALTLAILATIAACYFKSLPLLYLIAVLLFAGSMISLFISFYIYDLSHLYQLDWIDSNQPDSQIVNIHAGFDETSILLARKYKDAELRIIDFYDPEKHTELSIKRARKVYPAHSQTIRAQTNHLPIQDNFADKIFAIFSAHEIRNEIERTAFISELGRIIKPGGEIYITEHLRDLPNFLAYNIGFFHFYSRKSWTKIFRDAKLKLNREIKITPFISTFIISTNDNSF